MKIICFVAFAISGLVGTAAVASPANELAPTTTAAVAAAIPASADKRRYCVQEAVIGSRIPVRECKSRADWARDGVDIDKLNK